jgi:hypothetical protein
MRQRVLRVHGLPPLLLGSLPAASLAGEPMTHRSFVIRVCVVCDRPFLARRVSAYLCSPHCRQVGRWQRERYGVRLAPRSPDVAVERACARCGRVQPASEYHLWHADRTIRRTVCRRCALDATQAWRDRHRDELNARRRAAYAEARSRSASSAEASRLR